MLLKRMNVISDSRNWYYSVNIHKSICFYINRDRSIERISLVDIETSDPVIRHDMKTLCYMENITIDDGELLNVDALLNLVRREDTYA